MENVRDDETDGMTAARLSREEPDMTPAYASEQDLAVGLAAREPDAWRQLFDEQYERVHRYAFLRTGNAADADDIASATFAAAARSIGSYEFRGAPIAAWMFRIAHHETADLLTRRSRRPAANIERTDAAATLRAPDEIAASAQRLDLAAAMAKLKPEHRDVLMLRLVEGRSVAEVAGLLGKSEGAVKVQQMRALDAMRRAMGISKERA